MDTPQAPADPKYIPDADIFTKPRVGSAQGQAAAVAMGQIMETAFLAEAQRIVAERHGKSGNQFLYTYDAVGKGFEDMFLFTQALNEEAMINILKQNPMKNYADFVRKSFGRVMKEMREAPSGVSLGPKGEYFGITQHLDETLESVTQAAPTDTGYLTEKHLQCF